MRFTCLLLLATALSGGRRAAACLSPACACTLRCAGWRCLQTCSRRAQPHYASCGRQVLHQRTGSTWHVQSCSATTFLLAAMTWHVAPNLLSMTLGMVKKAFLPHMLFQDLSLDFCIHYISPQSDMASASPMPLPLSPALTTCPAFSASLFVPCFFHLLQPLIAPNPASLHTGAVALTCLWHIAYAHMPPFFLSIRATTAVYSFCLFLQCLLTTNVFTFFCYTFFTTTSLLCLFSPFKGRKTW